VLTKYCQGAGGLKGSGAGALGTLRWAELSWDGWGPAWQPAPCSPGKAAGGAHGAEPPANRATPELTTTEPIKNAMVMFCLTVVVLPPVFFLVAEASFQRGRGRAVCRAEGQRWAGPGREEGSTDSCWQWHGVGWARLALGGHSGEGAGPLHTQGGEGPSLSGAAPSSPPGQRLVRTRSETPSRPPLLSTVLTLVFNLKVW